jgi:hypothetical protein
MNCHIERVPRRSLELHGWQLGSFLQLVDLKRKKERKKKEEGIIHGHKKRGKIKRLNIQSPIGKLIFFYLEQ